jgi:hypothetical protein
MKVCLCTSSFLRALSLPSVLVSTAPILCSADAPVLQAEVTQVQEAAAAAEATHAMAVLAAETSAQGLLRHRITLHFTSRM